MNLFLLVVLLLVTLGMIGIILLQRSESGGLGSAGGMGGLMSARGRKDFMTRTTAVLATCFMVLCILLAILTGRERRAESSLVKEDATEVIETVEEVMQTDTMPPISAEPTAVVTETPKPVGGEETDPSQSVVDETPKVAPIVMPASEGAQTPKPKPKVASSKAKKTAKKKTKRSKSKAS